MRDARTAIVLRFLPVFVFAASFAMGLARLWVAHPEEDAFILFKYVANLVAGHGLVFFGGGPRAEGATDFLWLLLLAGCVRVGMDVAVAACLWNALGTALASAIYTRAIASSGVRASAAWAFAIAPAALVFSAPALAGYGGFSTALYSALALLAFRMTIAESPRAVACVPLVSLVLALFRPDGVILGAAFASTSFYSCVRARRVGLWIACALLAVIAGGAYLAWRRDYFGLALPLPLYVKRNGVMPFSWSRAISDPVHALPGTSPTLHWILSPLGAAPIAIAIAASFVLATHAARREGGRLLAWCAPAFVLLAGLAFGRQTQNYAFRFQGPAVWMLGYVALSMGLAVARDAPGTVRAKLSTACVALAHVAIATVGIEHLSAPSESRTYVDVFSRRLAEVLPRDRVLAITEAGRLAYWSRSRVEDIVGLNNPATATRPPTVPYLRGLDPDVVMFHVADVFALPDSLSPERAPMLALPLATLDASVREKWKALYGRELDAYPPGGAPESVAPAVMGRFLVESRAYDVYALRYHGEYTHVYGVKRDLAEHDSVVAAMRESTLASSWRSYADLAEL